MSSFLRRWAEEHGVGAQPVQEVASQPEPAEAEFDSTVTRALALLNRLGARIVIFSAGDEATGIWSDLDGPEVRAAIQRLGRGDLPVVYLDSPRCPKHYKVRRVQGDLIPLAVLVAMEAADSEPWRVRDELLGTKRE